MNYKESEIKFNGCWMWINNIRFRKIPFKSKKEIFTIVEKWMDGMPVKQIELAYKVNQVTFQKIRKALGIKMKHGGHQLRGKVLQKRKDRHACILKELNIGKSIKEIARELKVSISLVTFVKKIQNGSRQFFQEREY